MTFMSSALPNHVTRHNPGGGAAAASVTGQSQDTSSSYAPQPPPARPITDSTAHVAGLFSEYDASEHTETFNVPGSPIVAGKGSIAANGVGATNTGFMEVQNIPEEQRQWEAQNESAGSQQEPWEPELLLMPGAGLPRDLMKDAALSEEGLRHRASARSITEQGLISEAGMSIGSHGPQGHAADVLPVFGAEDARTNKATIATRYDSVPRPVHAHATLRVVGPIWCS